METSHNDSVPFKIEDNILKGKVVPYHEEHSSLGEFILRTLEGNPDLVGQIDVVTGKEYTYRTMRERSVRCALWLQSKGLRPKDLVALATDDHADYAIACFAIEYLGAVPTPWDRKIDEEEFLYRLNITKPKMAFTNEASAVTLAEAAKKAKLDLDIIVFGHIPGFFEFDKIITEPEIDEVNKFECFPIRSSEETAFIVFTSGTTGFPKGVALSHKALTMLSRQVGALGMSGNKCLTFTIIDWINSIESILMYLLLNMPRLILPSFTIDLLCATIQKYKITWVYMEPSIIAKILRSENLGKYDLSSVSHIFYSGNMLHVEVQRAIKKLIPSVQITSGYGSTEVCGYISIQSRKSQPVSIGEIMENAQLKVVDLDTGRTLGPNQKGELLLKFACMMNHYLNDPEATNEVLDKDGWMHPGDVGYYDENGEIFLVDRLKDTIYIADHDIAPSEIEGVILSHPGVKDVAVVGQPHPPEDDLLIAFVVRADHSSDTSKQVTEEDIVNLVAEKLPETRWLRAGVRFIDDIPKTRSNKIRRTVLRDLARSMVQK